MMKPLLFFDRTFMKPAGIFLSFLAWMGGCLHAQTVVAPSPETVGSVRGEDYRGYNFVSSFETGYRFHSVDGNQDRYRSDVNFGNGLRLLGSTLRVNSKEGHGKLFDELVLTTQGLGNDPYQSSGLRIQRNRLYRYDLNWRLNEYVNPGLSTASPTIGHALNTRRQWQDHDIVILPDASFQFFLGYSRNSQDGPGLVSTQLYDSRGDEYPLFALVNRRQSEYRLGAQARIAGIRLMVMRGWQQYRENTPVRLNGAGQGENPNDANTLSSFNRTEPYEGRTPFWRLNLYRDKQGWFAVNGRLSYSGGRRNFLMEELSIGTNRFGVDQNRQIAVSGSGRRPLTNGALTLSFFPSSRVTLTNHTSYSQVLMDGDSTYREVANSIPGTRIVQFQSLGIRSVVNVTDLNYRLTERVGLYAGYQYAVRRIQSREGFTAGVSSGLVAAEQNNHVNAGRFGIRYAPVKPFTLTLDAEGGRTTMPFFPISSKNYHALGGRAQYRSRTLLLSASARSNYDTNSTSLYVHSSRGRNYALDASWSAVKWISVDTGYAKMHLDTLSGIAYFAGGNLVTNDKSLYVSNVHAANLGVRFSIRDRADFYAGYSRVQDTGDGRSGRLAASAEALSATAEPVFLGAQTLPLKYDSPQARLSVRLNLRLRWNLGYQFYRYGEDFSTYFNYRAHTGFTSVIWSF